MTGVLASEKDVVTIRSGETLRMEIVIPVALEIRGRVVGDTRLPIANAEIVLGLLATRDHDAAVVALSDPSGLFVVRTGVDPSVIGARAAGYAPSDMLLVASDGVYNGVELVLKPNGGSVTGKITDRSGSPVAATTVRVGSGRMDAIHPIAGVAPAVPAQVWTDADGYYLANGIPAGTHKIFVHAADWAPWEGSCIVKPGETTVCDVVVDRGGDIAGIVNAETGEPVNDAVVSVGQRESLSLVMCKADENGRYALRGVASGMATVIAEHKWYGRQQVSIAIEENRTSLCDFTLQAGRVLIGRLLSTEGKPIERVALRVSKLGGGWGVAGITPDHDGRFRVINVPEGLVNVFFEGATIVSKEFRRIDPGPKEIEFRVKAKPSPTASVGGLVVDPDGAPIAGAEILLMVDEGGVLPACINSGKTNGRTGGFKLSRIAPDVYSVRIDASGFARRIVTEVHVSAYEEHDIGTVTMSRGGRIRLENHRDKPDLAEVEVWNEREEWMGDISNGLSMPLAAGDYHVRIRGRQTGESVHDVTVVDDRTTGVTAQWRAGRLCRLELVFEVREFGEWVNVVYRPQGEPGDLLRQVWLPEGESSLTDERWLGMGKYEIVITRGPQNWRGSVDVLDLEEQPQVIKVACKDY